MNDGCLENREKHIIARRDGSRSRDGTGKLVDFFDEWADRTHDRSGRTLGDGDQRLRQLGKDQASS